MLRKKKQSIVQSNPLVHYFQQCVYLREKAAVGPNSVLLWWWAGGGVAAVSLYAFDTDRWVYSVRDCYSLPPLLSTHHSHSFMYESWLPAGHVSRLTVFST